MLSLETQGVNSHSCRGRWGGGFCLCSRQPGQGHLLPTHPMAAWLTASCLSMKNVHTDACRLYIFVVNIQPGVWPHIETGIQIVICCASGSVGNGCEEGMWYPPTPLGLTATESFLCGGYSVADFPQKMCPSCSWRRFFPFKACSLSKVSPKDMNEGHARGVHQRKAWPSTMTIRHKPKESVSVLWARRSAERSSSLLGLESTWMKHICKPLWQPKCWKIRI